MTRSGAQVISGIVMAVTKKNELIWQGRLHIGDEPGIYGDAAYCGLSAELPFTIYRSDVAMTSFKLVLETEGLETFPNYLGHGIDVVMYLPDTKVAYHSIEKVVAQARFTGVDKNRKDVIVSVGNEPGPFRLSIRLRCDTTVNPGFYDDFVLRKLSLTAKDFSFYASFGFP